MTATLAYALARARDNVENPPPPEIIRMAVVVVAPAPFSLLHPFLERYFTRGVLTRAIKA